MEEIEKILIGSYVYARTMLLFRVRDDALLEMAASPLEGKSLFSWTVDGSKSGGRFLRRSKYLGLFGQSSLTVLESLCTLSTDQSKPLRPKPSTPGTELMRLVPRHWLGGVASPPTQEFRRSFQAHRPHGAGIGTDGD